VPSATKCLRGSQSLQGVRVVRLSCWLACRRALNHRSVLTSRELINSVGSADAGLNDDCHMRLCCRNMSKGRMHEFRGPSNTLQNMLAIAAVAPAVSAH